MEEIKEKETAEQGKEVLILETIEMYVSTTLHGSAKRTGKVMYTLRMKMGEKQYYEKPAEIGKADGTANRLVLWSICRALERMRGNSYPHGEYLRRIRDQSGLVGDMGEKRLEEQQRE